MIINEFNKEETESMTKRQSGLQSKMPSVQNNHDGIITRLLFSTTAGGFPTPWSVAVARAYQGGVLSSAILFVSMLIYIAVPSSLQAQSTRPDRGTGQGPQQVTGLDNINLQNGSVSLDIPLASLPPMAGGKLGYTLTAHYNSKLWQAWRSEVEGAVNGGLGCPELFTKGLLEPTTVAPWTISAGYEIIFKDAYYDDFSYVAPSQECGGYEYYYMQGRFFRPVLKTPDGGEHEMRIDGYWATYGGSRPYLSGYYQQSGTTPNQPDFSSPTRFYTVDGTYFTAIVNPASYSTKWTVWAKDGTKIEQTGAFGLPASKQTITDTNGNSIEFGFDATYGFNYAKDLYTGRMIKWITTYSNGIPQSTHVQYQSTGGAWQSVFVTWGTTIVQGMVYTTNAWDSYLEQACTVDQVIPYSQFHVIRAIEFPNTESGVPAPKYNFAYNSDTSAYQEYTLRTAGWKAVFIRDLFPAAGASLAVLRRRRALLFLTNTLATDSMISGVLTRHRLRTERFDSRSPKRTFTMTA